MLREAERTVAEPGAGPGATAVRAVLQAACRARRPRADLRPGISRRRPTARLLAGQQSAAMAGELAVGLGLVRHGGALR
jgi:MoxR-like ATPase